MPDLPRDPDVAAYFAATPETQRQRLIFLRSLIHSTAAAHEGVSPLTETLKWGEPSYAPARPRIGSSVRLQWRDDGSVALMFICHTHLVARFRELYPDVLAYEGDRAIVLSADDAVPEAELGHCIALALTYHRRG